MPFIHGKNTVIKVNAVDLSQYTDSSELERTADSHDVTTYGKAAHVYQGGLLDGKAKMSGTYNDAVAGPRATLEPLIGTVVPLIRQVAGVGTGKPQDTADVLITGYTETNPVADMVKWSCDMQVSGDVATTAQV